MLDIKINRTLFLKNIQIVEKAVSENKIRPIISGIYIEAKNGQIVLKGTDLELTITTVIDGEIIGEGQLVFSHGLIQEYLKEINDEVIHITENQGTIAIKTAESESEFVIFDAEEYPAVKYQIEGEECNFPKEKFFEMMEKAKIAVHNSPENLSINCVRLEIEKNIINMVSSDTFRMIFCWDNFENEIANEIKVSIPLKTVDSLLKISKLIDSEELKIKYQGNQIFFVIGKINILSRIIDLPFPNYKSIFSKNTYDKEVTINRNEFYSVLKRVLIFVKNNEEAKNGSIYEFEEDKLLIKGISSKSKINEQLDIQKK